MDLSNEMPLVPPARFEVGGYLGGTGRPRLKHHQVHAKSEDRGVRHRNRSLPGLHVPQGHLGERGREDAVTLELAPCVSIANQLLDTPPVRARVTQ